VATARRFALVLAAAALAAAALRGMAGLTELALYAGPMLAIAALLLHGRFVGERRILARWAAVRPPRRRPARPRWAHGRERALTALRSRGAWTLRGPPAPAAA
jgi:hypothetical protein